jgi:CRP/FNR family cyclic AMP-dependent transcriptional regulator
LFSSLAPVGFGHFKKLPSMVADEYKPKAWYFENFNIFQALCLEERKNLASRAYQWQAAKGEAVFLPGQPANTVYILKEGKVKLAACAGDGRENIINILYPGEIFGELALADEGKRNALAVTLEPSFICAVALDHFQEVLERNPNFNLQITKMIGKRLSKVQSRLTALCFKSASERIRSFIAELAGEYGRRIGQEIEVKLYLKHEEIAQLTATSRQTVTSALNELSKQNVILYDRRRILVRNMDALLSSPQGPDRVANNEGRKIRQSDPRE